MGAARLGHDVRREVIDGEVEKRDRACIGNEAVTLVCVWQRRRPIPVGPFRVARWSRGVGLIVLMFAPSCLQAAPVGAWAAMPGRERPSAAQSAAPPVATLAGIGEPVLDAYEEPVRRQLLMMREKVSEVLARDDLSPQDQGGALGQLGALYLLYDFMDLSEPLLRRARELQNEDFRWPHLLSILYQYEGDPQQGLENAERAAHLRPEYVPAALRAGDFALELRRWAVARQHYERALELDGSSGAARCGLARLALDVPTEHEDEAAVKRRAELAIKLLQEAVPTQPRGSIVHYHLARAFRLLGDHEKARAEMTLSKGERIVFPDGVFDSLMAQNQSRESYFSRGSDALRQGRSEDALAAFKTLLEGEPENAESHYNVAMALIETGRFEEAEPHLRLAVQYREDYRDAHYNLALLLAQNGDRKGAAENLERVVAIDPDDLAAKTRLADAYRALGNPQRAIRLLEEVIAADAALAGPRMVLGSMLVAQGETNRGLALLQGVADQFSAPSPERAEALFRLATGGGSSFGDQRASDLLEEVLKIDPFYAEAKLALAQMRARQRRYDEAGTLYDELASQGVEDISVAFGRSLVWLLAENYEKASVALAAASGAFPEDISLRHLLARFLATCPDDRFRDGRRAVDLMQGILARQTTVDFVETLAMAEAEIGDMARAADLQQSVLDHEQQATGSVLAARRQRLERYRAGQPVRAPWIEGS